MPKSKLLDRAVVVLVIVGLLAVGGGIWLQKSFSTHLGFTLLWVAFSAVVIENYVSGRPVQTRGGVVRREDGSLRYALPFLGFGVMIVLSAIMLLAAWFMS